MRSGILPPPPGIPSGSFAVELGDGLKVYTPLADPAAQRRVDVQRAKAGPAAMDAQAYFLMRHRQVVMLTMLLAWGDSYQRNVLGRDGKLSVVSAFGCSQCGAHSCEGGKRLLLCPCGYAAYCSTQCQKVDWPAHKAECKRTRAQKKAANA
ncbi:hypothetical protein ABPG77_005023 [Micractinium sp. CCAP 211/92]